MRAKDGQIYALKQELEDQGIDTGEEGVYVINGLLDTDLDSLEGLTNFAWNQFKEMAYPNWTEDDWTLDEDIADTMQELKNEYRETIMGQETLF
jgi:hypothetical protein